MQRTCAARRCERSAGVVQVGISAELMSSEVKWSRRHHAPRPHPAHAVARPRVSGARRAVLSRLIKQLSSMPSGSGKQQSLVVTAAPHAEMTRERACLKDQRCCLLRPLPSVPLPSRPASAQQNGRHGRQLARISAAEGRGRPMGVRDARPWGARARTCACPCARAPVRAGVGVCNAARTSQRGRTPPTCYTRVALALLIHLALLLQ